MPHDICAITAPFPGVLRVLQHGQRLDLWDLCVLGEADVLPAAKLYILGAWHPQAYPGLVELLHDRMRAQVVVLWTSSGGEVGFEPVEAGFLKAILDDPRIARVWFGDQSLAQVFSKKGFWAPYPVSMPGTPKILAEHNGSMTLFAPATTKKNALNNMLAAAIIQQYHPDLILDTNMPVPALLDGHLKARKYDWLPEERYRPLLAGSSLNFACSWAETLSYQSIEAALLGVPSVGSATIPWLPAKWRADPNDPAGIASVGYELIGQGEEARRAATEYAAYVNDLIAIRFEQWIYPLLA